MVATYDNIKCPKCEGYYYRGYEHDCEKVLLRKGNETLQTRNAELERELEAAREVVRCAKNVYPRHWEYTTPLDKALAAYDKVVKEG